MATPESRVKAKLRRLFKGYRPDLYDYWPVPSIYGATTLDVLGCYRGRFFSVETKAQGRKPTLRQTKTINSMEQAMGRVFVVTGMNSPVFDELKAWLDDLTEKVPHAPHLTSDTVNRHPI
jgi:hypothetical protein